MPNVSSGAAMDVTERSSRSDAARRDGIGLLQSRLGEYARLLEDRVGNRADVRVDPAQVGDQVEVQRRGLDAFNRLAGEPLEVGIRVSALEIAEQHLLRKKL